MDIEQDQLDQPANQLPPLPEDRAFTDICQRELEHQAETLEKLSRLNETEN